MFTLYKNLDPRQPVRFNSVDDLKKAIMKNPFDFDGLAYFESVNDEDAIFNLVCIDGTWEVEEQRGNTYEPNVCSNLKEAIHIFVELLRINNVV